MSNAKNHFLLTGYIMNEVYYDYTKNDKAHAFIILSVQRRYLKGVTNEKIIDHIPLNAYGKVASKIIEEFEKGDLISVSGEIETLVVERRTSINLVIKDVVFLHSDSKNNPIIDLTGRK